MSKRGKRASARKWRGGTSGGMSKHRTSGRAPQYGTREIARLLNAEADARRRAPAPTQTTTTRAALVTRTGHRSANGALAYDPGQQPTPALTTQQDLALVYANRAHSEPKPAAEHPTQAVCTAGHLGVVMRNNNSRGDSGAMCTPIREPVRAVTTAGHRSLVIPYDRTGLPLIADAEPACTLTTKDRCAVVLTDEEIDDCRFRMFALHEIASAMAMTDHPHAGEYVVLGNKRERMAQYGNAVVPPVMQWLVERIMEVL